MLNPNSNSTFIPNKEKEASPEKCQMIYWNILEMMESKSTEVRAVTLVREIFQTQRCDHQSDLSTLRNSYKTYVDQYKADTLTKIMDIEQTGTKDEEIALQAFTHYQAWTKKLIIGSLNWPQWIKYYTFSKAEQTFGKNKKNK